MKPKPYIYNLTHLGKDLLGSDLWACRFCPRTFTTFTPQERAIASNHWLRTDCPGPKDTRPKPPLLPAEHKARSMPQ